MSLALKVKTQGITKTLQFSGDMSIHEVCKVIKEKFDCQGGADHGLFYPEQGKWLLPNKVIDFYELGAGDLVEYKKKHRQLKFRTLDGSIKTAIIDETLPVFQLVEVLCARIGITNTDEYSLQPEKSAAPDPKKAKGKSGKVEAQIKDDARWLNPDKTLAEQGIMDTDLVILKKKFFFTDQNIDRNDPVQLNMLFNQAKENILLGKNPCTVEEAAQFAAIQCQVQYGNHEPDKHKAGFLKLVDFVPPEYRKKKDMDKKIFHEHKKLQGLSDLNAKFRYVQLSRSLKTYGITFFLVKERAKKNKLIPALIGVTKSSVVKLDMETKEIITEWKLTQLRRWAASPNSFTLDFGDYAESYYSVQTTEGEQISQLIAGYIDIILKKRKEVEKIVVEDEVEETTVEEYIKPTKATNFVGVVNTGHRIASETKMVPHGHLAAGMKPGFSGEFQGQLQKPQQVVEKEPDYVHLQKAFQMGVKAAMAMLKHTAVDLDQPANLPPIGEDSAAQAWKEQTVDVNTSNIAAQIAAQLATAASIMNNATGNPEEMDFELLQSDISSLTTTLSQMAPAVKLVANLSGDDGDILMEAVMELVRATTELINSAQQVAQGDEAWRNQLHSNGQSLAIAAKSVLGLMQRAELTEDEQLDLSDLAANVGKAVMDLVTQAKNVSKSVQDAETVQSIISDAKFAFETSTNLVACVNTCAPTANVQQCTDQILEGSVLMREVVGMLANVCGVSTNMELVDNFMDAAQRVEEAIALLVDKGSMMINGAASKAGQDPKQEENELDKHYDVVVSSCDKMLDNAGEMEGIIQYTKTLTMASTQFVAALKKTANDCADEDERLRLINAAKNLASATSNMVANAKDAARAVRNTEKQDALKSAILELKKSSNAAAGPQLRDRAMYKLSKAVKDVIASSKQLTATVKSSAPSNRNQANQLQMNQSAKKVSETIPAMISALKRFHNAPSDMAAQTKLVHSAKQCLMPGYALVEITVNSAPSVGDTIVQGSLSKFAKMDEDNLLVLDKILELVDDLNSEFQMQNALVSIKSIQKELVITEATAFPTNYATPEDAQLDLYSVAASIQGTIQLLAETAAKGNEQQTGAVATEAVIALQSLTTAVQGYAATEEDADYRMQLLMATTGVGDKLVDLISAAKKMAEGGEYIDDFSSLAMNASKALTGVVTCMPGQRELERAAAEISNVIESAAVTPAVNKPPELKQAEIVEARHDLQNTATRMTMAANSLLAASTGTTADLQAGAESMVEAFRKMVESTMNFGANSEEAVATKLSTYIHEVGTASAVLLQASKGLAADKDNLNFRDQLLDSAKNITDAMGGLLELCAAVPIGHNECNEAVQILSITASKLDSVTESGSNSDTYGECVQKLSEKTKAAVGAVSTLNTVARAGDMSRLAAKAIEVATAVAAVIPVVSRAAYLVGLSHPSTIPATTAAFDRTILLQNSTEVKESCKNLVDPNKTQKEILEAAATVAKSTSAFCSTCKTIGQNTSIIPSSRQVFITSAKDLANQTSTLVQDIKQLALEPTDEARQNCKDSYEPLIRTIDHILAFSASPEFCAAPAKICAEGILLQKPILESEKKVLSNADGVINTIKLLCTNSDDENLFKQLSLGVKSITEALGTVAKTISISTPGQKECEAAITKISEDSSAIDQALVESTINALDPSEDVIENAALADSIRAYISLVDIVSKVVRSDPGQMGQSLNQMPDNFKHIMKYAIASASNLNDLNSQKLQLDEMKSFSDHLLEFLYTIKGGLVGIKNVDIEQKLEESKGKVRESLMKLCTIVEGASATSGAAEFLRAIERIEQAQNNLEPESPSEKHPYHYYSEKIEEDGKHIVETVGEILSKTKTLQQYKTQAEKLAELSIAVAKTVKAAINSAAEADVKQSLGSELNELLISHIRLVESMQIASGKSGADQASRAKLTQNSRNVSMHVSSLITAAKEGSRGLLFCQEALSGIENVVVDFESCLIFAQAGQLDPLDSTAFATHKDAMMTDAKFFTERIKSFITTISGNHEELGELSVSTVRALEALRESVKRGATAISSADKNMQQHLLSAGVHVAQGLQTVISSAMAALGKNPKDPLMTEFSNAIKNEFGHVAELVRITKVLSDESTRSTRALDVTIEEIENALIELESDNPAQGTSLPDEVATVAKLLASAAANLVTVASKGGKQDELIAAANVIKKQAHDLCRAGKAACANAPQEERQEMNGALKKTCRATQALLTAIKESRDASPSSNSSSPETGQPSKISVQIAAKAVALAVSEIVGASSNLIPTGYVDMSDPNVVAERELLAAATMIEAAAKKLASFKPPEPAPGISIDDMNFEGQILEAAKSIAQATSALVRSATSVQREIIARAGPLSDTKDMYFNDGTWSEGLVSAAKQVAAATSDLCESAHVAQSGQPNSRERVIVAAKSVSATTIQLLSAASVKADMQSASQNRLRAAGKAVTNATQQLVRASEESISMADTDALVSSDSQQKSVTASKVMEMEAQMSILKMEKELERARTKLSNVRKGKYEEVKAGVKVKK